MNDLGRSHRSTHKVQIDFVNRFPGPVNLLWLDFLGQEVSYGVLEPGGSIHIEERVA